MNQNFNKLLNSLASLGYDISKQVPEEQIIILNDETKGLANTFLNCTGSLLIIEQYICKLNTPSLDTLLSLLKMNRKTIHGAFAIDEKNENIVFRDTLQLDNLDSNEIQASLNSIGLVLAENVDQLILISK